MKSTTVVIFGITGDLANRKLLPTFSDLKKKGKLPKKFRIVGFSRSPFIHHSIRSVRGQFDDQEAYKKLAEKLAEIDNEFRECSSKIFYLAVPPHIYEMVIKNLYKSGLHIHCGTSERQTKILIEKPFGSNLQVAKKLDKLLGELFKESQIYRIDHYLGKESLQKIGRCALNPKKIEKVEINILEQEGVGKRGAFYDKVGALKDVGQNHLLQMLTTVAGKAALSDLKLVRGGHHERGQYKNYKKEIGVAVGSETETFFKLEVRVDNNKWAGVSFVLASGKKMGESKGEVIIYFRSNEKKIFKIESGGYERVLLDAMADDHTIFPTTTEIMHQWKFIEKASKILQKIPLKIY